MALGDCDCRGQVIERGRVRAPSRPLRRQLGEDWGKTQSPDSGSKHKSEGDIGAASSA